MLEEKDNTDGPFATWHLPTREAALERMGERIDLARQRALRETASAYQTLGEQRRLLADERAAGVKANGIIDHLRATLAQRNEQLEKAVPVKPRGDVQDISMGLYLSEPPIDHDQLQALLATAVEFGALTTGWAASFRDLMKSLDEARQQRDAAERQLDTTKLAREVDAQRFTDWVNRWRTSTGPTTGARRR